MAWICVYFTELPEDAVTFQRQICEERRRCIHRMLLRVDEWTAKIVIDVVIIECTVKRRQYGGDAQPISPLPPRPQSVKS